jgi:hypothetical protein
MQPPEPKVQYFTEASKVGKDQNSPRLQKIGRYAMNMDIKKDQIRNQQRIGHYSKSIQKEADLLQSDERNYMVGRLRPQNNFYQASPA